MDLANALSFMNRRIAPKSSNRPGAAINEIDRIFFTKKMIVKTLSVLMFILLCACSTIDIDKGKNATNSYTRKPVSAGDIYGIWERVDTSHVGTSYIAILNGCTAGRIYFPDAKVRLNQKEILLAINNGMIYGGKVIRWSRCNVVNGKFMEAPKDEHSYMENYYVYHDGISNGKLQYDEISMVYFVPNWNGGLRLDIPPPPQRYRRIID